MFTSRAYAATFVPGEKIIYDIKKFGMRIGGAELVFNGLQKFEGKDVVLLTFTAHSLNFFDEEKIYMDPSTFFPIVVERDLNVFGNKEKITERYDSAAGRVEITKVAGGKTVKDERIKSGRLDNIYSFIYRYRDSGAFKQGGALRVNLPTKDVTIRVIDMKKIEAGGVVYDAFYMETTPKQFSVWFEAGDKKIPLRIDGAVGVNKAVMIMKKYERP